MTAISVASCGGLLGAAGLLEDGQRFAPLLDHLLQEGRDLLVGDGGRGGDVALLQRGADEAQRRQTRLVLRLERSVGLGLQPVAHGSSPLALASSMPADTRVASPR